MMGRAGSILDRNCRGKGWEVGLSRGYLRKPQCWIPKKWRKKEPRSEGGASDSTGRGQVLMVRV